MLNFQKGLMNIGSIGPAMAGTTYTGPICRGCQSPIHALPAGAKLAGEGRLRIPCPFCFADENYDLAELREFKRADDWSPPGWWDIKPSGSFRRPLSDSYPGVRPIFGGNPLRFRPIAASLIAQCITHWATVETGFAGLLAQFLGANEPAAIAVFNSIRSSRTQGDALEAASAFALLPRDKELFDAISKVARDLEKERNRLAHGSYGLAYSIERGIAWQSIEDQSRRAYSDKQLNPVTDPYAAMWVYEPEDLQTLADRIAHISQFIGSFSGYLTIEGRPQTRDQRYLAQCNAPHIREALLQIRAGRKSGQPKPRKPQQPKKKKGGR